MCKKICNSLPPVFPLAPPARAGGPISGCIAAN